MVVLILYEAYSRPCMRVTPLSCVVHRVPGGQVLKVSHIGVIFIFDFRVYSAYYKLVRLIVFINLCVQ
jgi:hypothetical protein